MARLTPRTRLSVHATYDAPLQQQVKSSIKSPANTVHLISHRHHHPIALIRYLYPDTIYLSFETVRSIHDLKFTRSKFTNWLTRSCPSLPSLRDSVLKGDPLEARYSNKPRQVEAWHASLVTHCGYAQDAGTRCVDVDSWGYSGRNWNSDISSLTCESGICQRWWNNWK